MLEKLDLSVKVERLPERDDAWQVISLERAAATPIFLAVFYGAHAEDLATEYATAKFQRVQVIVPAPQPAIRD